jgi:hypothetical protein
VPKEFKGLLKKLLQTTGPLIQSNFTPEWKKSHPEKPFDYRAWGFEKLGAAFESMPDVVVVTKDGPKKSYVSLKGQALPAAAPATNGAGGAMSSDTMKGVLAGAIASKVAISDPKQIEAFMGQPKLQFTIDCLVEEFAKFAAAGHLCKSNLTISQASRSRPAPHLANLRPVCRPMRLRMMDFVAVALEALTPCTRACVCWCGCCGQVARLLAERQRRSESPAPLRPRPRRPPISRSYARLRLRGRRGSCVCSPTHET